ncbi:MAG TPA: protein kinase [Drouetiella sp.]
MAELTVTTSYDSPLTRTASTALRLTFPFWGIVAPFIGVLGVLTMAGALYQHVLDARLLNWIGIPLSWLATAVFCLLTMRLLRQNSLLLDKNGIRFPIFLRPGNRYVPWTSIRKIDVISRGSSELAQQKIAFYFESGSPLVLDLGNMKPAEIEQMLLAIDMWGNACERDTSLQLLQDSFKTKTVESGDVSYTAMWEDELRRRFSSTTFLPLAPGQVLRNGTLKVVRQLSLSGLAAVYLCQLDETKLVVLKEAVLPDDGSTEAREKAKELFEREAKFLMKLSHPGIVAVLDNFGESGRNYLMLEYVNGQDLRQFVKQHGPQKEALVLDWAMQAAGILKYLHEQDPPIIHRDLSPDNLVRRDDNTLVVIDFGASNEFLSKATGTFVGKQSFIAPEQFRGKAVVQSDIYALGCTMFHCLTGKEPEALSTSNPKTLNPDISDEIAEVVTSCTQMEARDRYQSAAQLLPVLRRLHSSCTL